MLSSPVTINDFVWIANGLNDTVSQQCCPLAHAFDGIHIMSDDQDR